MEDFDFQNPQTPKVGLYLSLIPYSSSNSPEKYVNFKRLPVHESCSYWGFFLSKSSKLRYKIPPMEDCWFFRIHRLLKLFYIWGWFCTKPWQSKKYINFGATSGSWILLILEIIFILIFRIAVQEYAYGGFLIFRIHRPLKLAYI